MKKQPEIYYPAFDYLRIILAIAVAVGHSGIAVWEQTGNYSVQVFFALSGWLIGGLLLRSAPADLPRFYFNRAARIWIPYFVAIVLLILASVMKDRITQKWFEIFFYDVTFVYNFFGVPQAISFPHTTPLDGTGNHLWSICAEEQFYLFAPFLITIPARIGRSIWFWCAVSILALTFTWWNYFGSIALGVLASVVGLRLKDWQTSRAAQIGLLIFSVLVLSATYDELISYRIGAPLSAIGFVLLLAQAGRHSPLGSFLGGVSYPMYLNHWIGIFAANAIFGKFGLRETFICHLSSVLISLFVAAILYIVIDRNVRNNRNRYFAAFRGKTVAVCGFALVSIGIIGGLLLTHGI